MKASILSRAIQGKLVEQRFSEGTPDNILSEIKKDKVVESKSKVKEKIDVDKKVQKVNLNPVEVADEKAPEQLSAADMEIVKRKEGERLLAKINDGMYVIALALDGKMKTSAFLLT